MKRRHSDEEIRETFKLLNIDSEDKRKEILKAQNIYESLEKKPSQLYYKN